MHQINYIPNISEVSVTVVMATHLSKQLFPHLSPEHTHLETMPMDLTEL